MKMHWFGCVAMVGVMGACNVDDSVEKGVDETSTASEETSEVVGEAEQALGGFGIDCEDWWANHYAAIDTDLTYSFIPEECEDPWGGGWDDDPWGGGGWGSGGFGDPDEEGPCEWWPHVSYPGDDMVPTFGWENAGWALGLASENAKTEAANACLASGRLCTPYVVSNGTTSASCKAVGVLNPDNQQIQCTAVASARCGYR